MTFVRCKYQSLSIPGLVTTSTESVRCQGFRRDSVSRDREKWMMGAKQGVRVVHCDILYSTRCTKQPRPDTFRT